METTNAAPGRGRPRTITRERITDAVIAIGLPKVSVGGIAVELGVSPKALYKHFPGPDELKQLAAEEIFARWNLPPFPRHGEESLEGYLLKFSASMWDLVEKHTGIAPYMLRRELITPAMVQKMAVHQQEMARVFGVSFPQANWLLFTVAYYCVAVADTVLPFSEAQDATLAAQVATQHGETEAEYRFRVKTLYALGSRALVTGSLAIVGEIEEK